MKLKNRKAFTMLELIFVVVIIGILSAIAIPKFAMTTDNAKVTKAKATVAAIRNAVATQRQQRILRGSFAPIFKLSSTSGAGTNKVIFDAFDGNVSNSVLQYPLAACETDTSKSCWRETTTGSAGSPVSKYTYNMPLTGSVVFVLENNRFACETPTEVNCKLLTR